MPEKSCCCSEGSLDQQACIDRRSVLLAGGLVASQTVLGALFPGRVLAQDAARSVQLSTYPAQKIAQLESLKPDQPVRFSYPTSALHTDCLLLRLSTRAGGGVGPYQNIVAFNLRCTHMGGDLTDGLREESQMLVCGEHLTSFDLTRHGMVVAGHATESLPQIFLEVRQGTIYAVGIAGLLYGYHRNPV